MESTPQPHPDPVRVPILTLNERVRVELTPFGRRAFDAYMRAARVDPRTELRACGGDADKSVWVGHLWRLAHIWGSSLGHHGPSLLFECVEIMSPRP
ncbi:MAG: hypothetical protein IV100_12515 [Myxococcales bacterium]|nr:hypothetical protein [Myxococcales bacterium]